MLPSFWRLVNHFWIGAGTVNAERSLLYFDGSGVGNDVLKVLAWTAVVVSLLLLALWRKLERQPHASTVTGVFTASEPSLASSRRIS
jgi:hypothetical protein